MLAPRCRAIEGLKGAIFDDIIHIIEIMEFAFFGFAW